MDVERTKGENKGKLTTYERLQDKEMVVHQIEKKDMK